MINRNESVDGLTTSAGWLALFAL